VAAAHHDAFGAKTLKNLEKKQQMFGSDLQANKKRGSSEL